MRVGIKLPGVSVALLLIIATAGADISPGRQQRNLVYKSEDYTRLRRQLTTTTPRPKKKRPSNIFSLISVLLAETRNDASRAFNEIGTLFNSQFVSSTRKPSNGVTSTTTTTTTPTTPSDNNGENEITTTTEPYRITREEFMGILRSNIQGIGRLFGKEFRIALRDSNRNVIKFGREFRESLRPYVT